MAEPPSPSTLVARGLRELETVYQKNPGALVQAMIEAAKPVTADAPDAGRAAYLAMLARAGAGKPALERFEASRALVASLDPTSAEALALVEPLLGLEFLDQFASAVELPAGFNLGVEAVLPGGFRQRAVEVGEAVDTQAVMLRADGQGAPGMARFTVTDPGRVNALWLALSGDALKHGHVVLVRVNEHRVSMGGRDPGRRSGGPAVELRRALPAAFLRAGENRLEAKVLGAPAGAPADPEGLKVSVRVR